MKITKLIAAIACILGVGLPAVPVYADDGHDHGEAPVEISGNPLPSVMPAVAAVSESFELVGRLTHDELSILVDRRATTEPVLDASLSVEVDGHNAIAPFHADHGDYVLTDAAMLARLRQIGTKPLVFTLTVGDETERLTGELDVHEETGTVAADHEHGWREHAPWIGGGMVVLAVLAVLLVVLLVLARRLRAFRRPASGGAA